jgi:hypothetical protein
MMYLQRKLPQPWWQLKQQKQRYPRRSRTASASLVQLSPPLQWYRKDAVALVLPATVPALSRVLVPTSSATLV